MEIKCPRCTQSFAEIDFKYSNGKRRRYCKICTSAYKKEHYDSAKATANAAHWKANNPEKFATYQTNYRADHRADLNERERQRRQRPEVKDKLKGRVRTATDRTRSKAVHQHRMATDAEYAAKKRANQRVAGIRYYWNHRSSVLEKLRQTPLTEEKRLSKNAAVRRWNKNHPEQRQAITARRKALQRGAAFEGFDEVAHRRWLLRWQQGRCAYCNKILDQTTKGAIHLDHVIAVTKEGRHAADNLVLSCPSCDSSKNNKILWDTWIPPIKQIKQVFVWQTELDDIFDHFPVKCLSTFLGSERNRIKQPPYNGLTIFDHEWEYRRTAVENLVTAKAGIAHRLYARNTNVVQVDSASAREFFETNHLQGFGRGSVYLGLEHDNTLVGLTSWLELSGAIELNRLAFRGSVIGGFSKLVAHFRKLYSGPILSYVDPRYATGQSYEKMGFKYGGESNAPIYYYVNGCGLYHRRLFMKNLLEKRLQYYNPNETEWENARRHGYYRVYGMKQKRFLLE